MQLPQVLQQQTSAAGQQQHIQLVPQVIGDQLQQLPLQAQIGANGQFQLVRVAGQSANAHGQPIILQAAPQSSAHSQQQAIYLPNGQQVSQNMRSLDFTSEECNLVVHALTRKPE